MPYTKKQCDDSLQRLIVYLKRFSLHNLKTNKAFNKISMAYLSKFTMCIRWRLQWEFTTIRCSVSQYTQGGFWRITWERIKLSTNCQRQYLSTRRNAPNAVKISVLRRRTAAFHSIPKMVFGP